jgi:hypothetical protein
MPAAYGWSTVTGSTVQLRQGALYVRPMQRTTRKCTHLVRWGLVDLPIGLWCSGSKWAILRSAQTRGARR